MGIQTVVSAQAGQTGASCCPVLLLILVAANAAAESDLSSGSLVSAKLTPAALEMQEARIGKITIDNRNIFDPADPAEDRWLYRMANTLHVKTRPQVIESQLLFAEGDEYSKQTAEETERLLRANHYIGDVSIEPVRYENGTVDLAVKTTDVWTLSTDLSFGRKGGVNTGGFGLKEYNLLGTGTYVAAKYKSDVDRSNTIFEVAKHQLRGSRYDAAASFSSNSDGFERQLRFGKPFYSLDSRNALGASFLAAQQTDTLYNLGEKEAQFEHNLAYHELSGGWSRGLSRGWTRRLLGGLVYDDHEFSSIPGDLLPQSVVPENRRYIFPYLGFELMEDHFETVRNFDQIQRTEDLYYGTRFTAKVGYSSESAGSSASGFHFNTAYSNGFQAGKKGTFLFGTQLGSRIVSGNAENVLLSGYVNYHWQQSEDYLLYVNLDVSAGTNLDLDNQVLLGGDSGLRGYPIRYQTGDSKALLTIEQRIFTDWFPFRLFHVGAAAFFDAGRTWGDSPVSGENLGLLRNVGVGLRLGNARASGFGRMLHIDLAFPLDGGSDIRGTQLLIEAKRSF
jgi:outer membrane protein assembly factor BamA